MALVIDILDVLTCVKMNIKLRNSTVLGNP